MRRKPVLRKKNGLVGAGKAWFQSALARQSAFVLRCLNLSTGEVQWEHRLQDRCNLLALDAHLLCVSEPGDLQLVEADRQAFNVQGELSQLLAPRTWAAPAFAAGRLYLRDDHHLICLDLRN